MTGRSLRGISRAYGKGLGLRGLGVDVSIIIVTYNVRAALGRCLATIPCSIGNLNAEVFVVDNGSNDGTWDSIAAREDLRAIRGSEELGFGRANNLAAAFASGRWLLFLNPDTEAAPGSLQQLVQCGDADPSLGVLGPRLELSNGTLDPAARRSFPTPFTAAMRMLRWPRRFLHTEVSAYNVTARAGREGAVDAVSGACMLVRRNAFHQVDGFDGMFFTYGEDLDLAYSLRQAGWLARYVPSAVVRHLKRQSTQQRVIRARYEFYRAMWLYYRKHRRGDPVWLKAVVTGGIFVLGSGAVSWQIVKRMITFFWSEARAHDVAH